MNDDQKGGIPEIDLEEEARATASVETQDEGQKAPAQAQKLDHDFLLQQLVQFANEWGVGSTVSLTLGGTTVSGEIISVYQYIDEFAAQYRSSFADSKLGENFFKLILSFKPEGPKPEGPLPEQLPQFIHMRNVRTYAPGRPQFAVHSALWRGRISDVIGFALGQPADPNKENGR